MIRADILAALNGERTYQDTRYSTYYSISEEILLMQSFLHRARDKAVFDKNDIEALNQIRKVAARAIRCLEHYGAPTRDAEDDSERRLNDDNPNKGGFDDDEIPF